MTRKMVFVGLLACAAAAGFSCAAPVLECSNPLDASQFGFTMTVPDGFSCTYAAPATNISPPAVAIDIWTNETTQEMLSLTVFDQTLGSAPAASSQLNYTDLENYQTSTITFTMKRGEKPDGTGGVFYVAEGVLPDGVHAVRIMLVAESASDAALTVLKTALNGVTPS
jgi:hypothetical protein